MRALICGAGVGGLSAGIALQRAGFDVVVLERAPDLRVSGFGLNLWPNAGRALNSLGLQSAYEAISVPLRRYWTLASTGDVIYKRDVADWPERFGAPATGVYRRELSGMLADALGTEHIRFGHELVDVREEGQSVVCTLADGEEAVGDLLVGADGIYSQTRTCLYGPLPHRENPHHTYRWRGNIRLADTDIDAEAETEVFGGRAFFGTIPTGGGRGYWFASGPGIDSVDDFMACFGAWEHTHVPGTIAASAREEIQPTQLLDLAEPPARWTRGRVTLLGDAAHPMMPDLAQGASQTFVDSQVLGECLAGGTAIVDGLREYEERRRPAAYAVVDLSRLGMFTRSRDGSGGDEVDPIALRYERGVEGVADVQV
jgi:2-polyprenyl-6-methoxyphenol hydroxylase-like FAD-dependent oxidoreductase